MTPDQKIAAVHEQEQREAPSPRLRPRGEWIAQPLRGPTPPDAGRGVADWNKIPVGCVSLNVDYWWRERCDTTTDRDRMRELDPCRMGLYGPVDWD